MWARFIKKQGWFITLPEEDKSYYVTFAGLTMNMAIFLYMLAGTAVTKVMEGSALTMLGISFVST